MKKRTTITTILLLLFAGTTFAQLKEISALLEQNLATTTIYTKTGTTIGKEKAYLEMPFGKATFKDRFKAAELRGKTIERIEYVYTDYSKAPDFSQGSLDNERLKTLYQFLPETFDNSLIQWSKTVQTNCKSPKEGKNYFHGFVVTYRPTPTKATMAKEIEYLEKIIAGEPVQRVSSNNINIPPVDEEALYVVTGSIEYIIDSEHSAADMTELTDFKDSGLVSTPAHRLATTLVDEPIVDRSSIDTNPTSSIPYYIPPTNDSVVTAVLNRNQWKNMMVITDVTGSMSPYTAQWMTWLKLNFKSNPTKMHVFFNDGNWKHDRDKVAGSTGGIYTVEASSTFDIYNTAFETMRNGGGGDTPENNIEATLRGIEQCIDCDNIVMIADNWATPRDLKFLDRVKKPLKIIVCGGLYGINPNYLNAARATGGSVHTIEHDLTELARLSEGETVKIGRQTFKMIKGKFVLMR